MIIKPAPRFAMLLLMFHGIAATVVYVAAIPLANRLAMLLLIFLSLSYYLARDVLLLMPDSWRKISLDQGSVSVVTRDGSGFIGQVANETVVSAHLIVLCLRLEGRRLLVARVIFPDALDAGAFRELCVRLRFS